MDKKELGLLPVACDVWNGFVFVNWNAKPEWPLVEFLGGLGRQIDGYPCAQMERVARYSARVAVNWKTFVDAFHETYHVGMVHARSLPGCSIPSELRYEFDGFAPVAMTGGTASCTVTVGVNGTSGVTNVASQFNASCAGNPAAFSNTSTNITGATRVTNSVPAVIVVLTTNSIGSSAATTSWSGSSLPWTPRCRPYSRDSWTPRPHGYPRHRTWHRPARW